MPLGLWLPLSTCCSAAASTQTALTTDGRLLLGETLLFVKCDVRMKLEDRGLQSDIFTQGCQV